MDFKQNPRFAYQGIRGRPDFAWPGNKKLAVYVALCVEHFSYGSGLGLPYSPGLNHPNSYNWGWREYGSRVGGWRLLELFEEYKLPLSVLLNTACYDHCPEVIAAFRARGDEIVAHGRTNSENANGMSEADERALIAEVTEAIKKHEGKQPGGWMSPGAHPSALTEDLLAEAGYRYTLDWPMDDQPVWMKTRSGSPNPAGPPWRKPCSIRRHCPANTLTESSRLYSPAMTRLTFLSRIEPMLPSLSNCSPQ
jgi:allantoinase